MRFFRTYLYILAAISTLIAPATVWAATYQYDALGRLKAVSRPVAVRQYTYDKSHNLIAITVTP